jgi:hypothetical protein
VSRFDEPRGRYLPYGVILITINGVNKKKKNVCVCLLLLTGATAGKGRRVEGIREGEDWKLLINYYSVVGHDLTAE